MPNKIMKDPNIPKIIKTGARSGFVPDAPSTNPMTINIKEHMKIINSFIIYLSLTCGLI